LVKNFRAGFNDNVDLRRTWGGNVLGIKSQHAEDLKKKAIEKE
jgi:large subunit ribosomal protein L7Ae